MTALACALASVCVKMALSLARSKNEDAGTSIWIFTTNITTLR